MSHATTSSSRKPWRKRLLIVWAVSMVLAAFATSIVLVDETESVIVDRFGSISAVYDHDEDRGLHWKLPWPIETTRSFDRRVQLLNLPGRELLTRDKKNLIVDSFVAWRIARPSETQDFASRPVVQFFQSLGTHETANSRLESQINSAISAEFGTRFLDDLLTTTAPGTEHLREIANRLRDELQNGSGSEDSLANSLGIEIVSIGFSRLNFPEGNRAAVYERMRSERRKIADQYRAEGLAESQVIRSRAEFRSKALMARAMAEATRIRGDAEAEATRILNEAHLNDPEFYRVLRSLDAYRQILHPETSLVLSTSSQLFKLLTDGLPELPAIPELPTDEPPTP